MRDVEAFNGALPGEVAAHRQRRERAGELVVRAQLQQVVGHVGVDQVGGRARDLGAGQARTHAPLLGGHARKLQLEAGGFGAIHGHIGQCAVGQRRGDGAVAHAEVVLLGLEHCKVGLDAALEQLGLEAGLGIAADDGRQRGVVAVLVVLRVEDARVAGIGRQRGRDVVHRAHIRCDLAVLVLDGRAARVGAGGAIGVGVAVPVGQAQAGEHRQRIGHAPACRGEQAGLLRDLRAPGACLGVGGRRRIAVPGVDVGDHVAPARHGRVAIGARGGAGGTHAHHQVVLAAAQLELARQVGVHRVLLFAAAVDSGIQRGARARHGVDEWGPGRGGTVAVGAQTEGVALGVVQRGLQAPVVVELVVQRGVERAGGALPACPRWRKAGGDRQVDGHARGGKARDGAPDRRLGVVGLALVAQCHHGGLADVGLHRSEQGGLVFGIAVAEALFLLRGHHQAAAHAAVAVERCVQVQLAPVQVPRACRERHRGRELALRALADHVDGGRRHAHTGLDAVGAAHDVDALVQRGVEFLVGAAAVAGQAVGLEVGDLEAARVVQRALRVIKTHRNAVHVAQHRINAGERLALDLRAGHGAGGLRGFARRQGQARGGAFACARDGDAPQRFGLLHQFIGGANWCLLGWLQRGSARLGPGGAEGEDGDRQGNGMQAGGGSTAAASRAR